MIELPLARIDRAEPSVDAGADATAALKVLVVDDEPAVSELMARVLGAEGHSVATAGGGSKTLARPDLGDFDVIILDVKIPVMGGEELFRRLQLRPGDLASRVVFVTGDTASAATEDFIRRSGNPVLGKPFPLEALTKTVRQVTRR